MPTFTINQTNNKYILRDPKVEPVFFNEIWRNVKIAANSRDARDLGKHFAADFCCF